MQKPPGYESLGEFVKQLLKVIYGLKQAAVKWYRVLRKALMDLGFTVSSADPGVFYVQIREHILVLVVCHRWPRGVVGQSGLTRGEERCALGRHWKS